MILKIIGSGLVICASTVIGYTYSRDCAKRPQDLRTLQSMLQMLENEISFLSSVLVEAFEGICRNNKNEMSVFFSKSAEYLRKDIALNASQAWEKAVRENIKSTSLNAEDEEILVQFGEMLGKSDVEGQVKNIRYVLNQLKIQEQKAEANRKKNESMYRSLGLLGGIAVVIILF